MTDTSIIPVVDGVYSEIPVSTTHSVADLILSKAERKKMIAREHNRQYQESKDNPQKQEVVKDAVVSAVQGYRKALGI